MFLPGCFGIHFHFRCIGKRCIYGIFQSEQILLWNESHIAPDFIILLINIYIIMLNAALRFLISQHRIHKSSLAGAGAAKNHHRYC